MKSTILLLITFITFSAEIASQNKNSFGVSGGFFYGIADITLNGIDISDNLEYSEGEGVYIGVTADISIANNKFKLQPELLYVFGGERGAFLLPILLRYYPIDKFNLMAGPQLDLFVNVPDTIKDYVNNLGLGVAVGLGYDINNRISVQAKYSLGLNERFNNSIKEYIQESLGDFAPLINLEPSFKANSVQIGLVYKF